MEEIEATWKHYNSLILNVEYDIIISKEVKTAYGDAVIISAKLAKSTDMSRDASNLEIFNIIYTKLMSSQKRNSLKRYNLKYNGKDLDFILKKEEKDKIEKNKRKTVKARNDLKSDSDE